MATYVEIYSSMHVTFDHYRLEKRCLNRLWSNFSGVVNALILNNVSVFPKADRQRGEESKI